MTFDWKNLIWHGTELISRAAIADVRASPFNRRVVNMKFCFAADDSVLAPQNFIYHYDFKRIRASAAFL